MVLGPGGATGEHVLDDGRGADRLSAPAVGIDASGTATAAWTRWDDGAPQRIRTARSAPAGAAWTLGPDLPAGARGLFTFTGSLVDVAVSPAGRTLLAWVTGDGIRASLDGEPDRVVGSAPRESAPVAAIGDDGSALVAFAGSGSRVLVAERPAGGGWLPQRELARGALGPAEGSEPTDDGVREVSLRAAFAPSGAAAVAWEGIAFGSTTPARGVGTAGRRLEPRGHAVLAGAPDVPMVAGPGSSRVGGEHARLLAAPAPARRAARAGGAGRRGAARRDRAVAAAGPGHRTGRVRVRVPVRCSEACDVRLMLASPVVDYMAPFAETVRALPAGGSATLRVGTDEVFANYLAGDRRYRRPAAVARGLRPRRQPNGADAALPRAGDRAAAADLQGRAAARVLDVHPRGRPRRRPARQRADRRARVRLDPHPTRAPAALPGAACARWREPATTRSTRPTRARRSSPR